MLFDVMYDFQESRASQCEIDFLQGHSEDLQVDGYRGSAYTGITLAGYWEHVAVNSKKLMSYKVKVNSKQKKRLV